MHGWVIYNGHLPGDKFKKFAEWIQKAGSEQQITIDIIKNNWLLADIRSDGSYLVKDHSLKQPDFVIFGDKDIPLARQLEAMKIPVFNCSEAIDICDNKITTYQRLIENNLPIPRTIIAPKIFPGVEAIDENSFIAVEKELNYPIVLKEAYGSLGEQVYLVHSRTELLDKVAEIKDRPFVFQQFIASSYGKDVRLNVVGNEVVASMLRYADDDFRANISSGKTTAYLPSKQEKELAIAATKAIGADFAGVDLLFGENGPVICEVNSNALVQKTLECTGINVTDFIVKYVSNTLAEVDQND